MDNIFDLIKKDHAKILEILRSLQETTTRSKKTREHKLAATKDLLLPHMHAEEELFYPALMNEGKEPKLVYEALEEHRAAQMVLADVEATPVSEEKWDGFVKVLLDLIEHHVGEEEGELFQMAHQFMDSNRAKEMGQQFQHLKQESMAMKIR
jgi:hemerythrin superfamily protein